MDFTFYCQLWGMVAAIVLPLAALIVGLFMWNRTEANADRREINQKIDANMKAAAADRAADRKDLAEKIEANMKEAAADRAADRKEAAADRKSLAEKMEANMAQTRAIIDAIQQEIRANAKETRDMINAIKEEAKDFHARLCVIESNRKIIINKGEHPKTTNRKG